jgi:predicted GNAT family acetyltransferase
MQKPTEAILVRYASGNNEANVQVVDVPTYTRGHGFGSIKP